MQAHVGEKMHKRARMRQNRRQLTVPVWRNW